MRGPTKFNLEEQARKLAEGRKWKKVENYDYASIEEGHVELLVAPATDCEAQLLPVTAICAHYRFHGQTQARFELPNRSTAGVYYLDLADYVILHWRKK